METKMRRTILTAFLAGLMAATSVQASYAQGGGGGAGGGAGAGASGGAGAGGAGAGGTGAGPGGGGAGAGGITHAERGGQGASSPRGMRNERTPSNRLPSGH